MQDYYIPVPGDLTENMLIDEFGKDAVNFYLARIKERKLSGHIYRNPLKTIWLWAYQDRKSHQGYYTTYCGFSNGRKSKNHGRS